MKKQAILHTPPLSAQSGYAKAILRGGTFHRIQVLIDASQSHILHCGLEYRVTRQKDAQGRVICVWARE